MSDLHAGRFRFDDCWLISMVLQPYASTVQLVLPACE